METLLLLKKEPFILSQKAERLGQTSYVEIKVENEENPFFLILYPHTTDGDVMRTTVYRGK